MVKIAKLGRAAYLGDSHGKAEARAVEAELHKLTYAVNQLIDAQGVLIEDIEVSTAATVAVKHGLQRAPKKVLISSPEGLISVTLAESNNPALYINLQTTKLSGAPVGTITATVSVWLH